MTYRGLLLFAVAPLIWAQLDTSVPWPKAGRNLKNTGYYSDTSIATGTSGDLRWKHCVYYDSDTCTIRAGPMIGKDDTVYVGTYTGYLYAVKDGEEVWSSHTEYCGYGISTPALDVDGIFIVGCRQTECSGSTDSTKCPGYGKGHVVAVNASTGAVVWKHETEEGVYSSPTITDAGKIVAPCIDGTLWVFSKSGEVELEKDLGDGMYKAPALTSAGDVIIGSYTGYWVKKVTVSGDVDWTFDTTDKVNSAAIVLSTGHIIVVDEKHVYKLTASGSLDWKYELPSTTDGDPSVDSSESYIYIGMDDYKLYCLTIDGDFEWSYTADAKIVYSKPAVDSDGTIYFGDYSGKVYAISSGGEKKWSYQCEGDMIQSSIAIGSDGTVYVGDSYGFVYAIYGTTAESESALAENPVAMVVRNPSNIGIPAIAAALLLALVAVKAVTSGRQQRYMPL